MAFQPPPGARATVHPHPSAAHTPPTITELAVMDDFIARHHTKLRFNHSNKQWLLWTDHCWQPDGKECAFDWAIELCRQLPPGVVHQKIRFAAAIERGARAHHTIATEQREWDANPWLLGTSGGVIDLQACVLRPGTPGDMISRTTAIIPADMPDCPLWLEFLDYALHSDQQQLRFLQRYLGYCLTGVTREEQFTALVGREGTGKGTLTQTVSYILGRYAMAAPASLFTSADQSKDEYYRAHVAGRRLVVVAEPEKGTVWREAQINEFTGSDTLSGRHPAGKPFDFVPTHKLLLNANHLPNLRGSASGLKRRLLVLPFDRQPVVANTTLKEQLREEAPAILRWLMEGCLAWQKLGLNPPDSVKLAGNDYFDKQDAFGRWVEDCCKLDPYEEETPSDVLKSYNPWARAHGEFPLNYNELASTVAAFTHVDQQTGAVTRLLQGRSKNKRFIKGLDIVSATFNPQIFATP